MLHSDFIQIKSTCQGERILTYARTDSKIRRLALQNINKNYKKSLKTLDNKELI